MTRSAHPVEMVDAFIKEATEAMRPYGVSSSPKALEGYNRRRPTYSQPNPPADATQPSTVIAQKELAPPPVT